MENVDGKKFIEIICQRLEDEGKLLYDSNIVMKIVTLTNRELNEIVSLGDAQVEKDVENGWRAELNKYMRVIPIEHA